MEDQMKEINAIIKKNLPAQVGKELQEVLAQAEADRATLKLLNTEFKKLEANYDKLKDKEAEWQDLEEKDRVLTEEREKFEEEKRDAKVKELEYKLEQANLRADTIGNYTTNLVRNTIVRKNILDTEHRDGFTNDQGTWIPPRNVTKNYTEDTSEE